MELIRAQPEQGEDGQPNPANASNTPGTLELSISPIVTPDAFASPIDNDSVIE